MSNFNLNNVINYALTENGIDSSKMQELVGRFGPRCDVIEGPCSCGFWHHLDELKEEEILVDKKAVSVSQFEKIMGEYNGFTSVRENKNGFICYSLAGENGKINLVGYKPGIFFFSGPRESIFDIQEKIAKDLGLKKY